MAITKKIDPRLKEYKSPFLSQMQTTPISAIGTIPKPIKTGSIFSDLIQKNLMNTSGNMLTADGADPTLAVDAVKGLRGAATEGGSSSLLGGIGMTALGLPGAFATTLPLIGKFIDLFGNDEKKTIQESMNKGASEGMDLALNKGLSALGPQQMPDYANYRRIQMNADNAVKNIAQRSLGTTGRISAKDAVLGASQGQADTAMAFEKQKGDNYGVYTNAKSDIIKGAQQVGATMANNLGSSSAYEYERKPRWQTLLSAIGVGGNELTEGLGTYLPFLKELSNGGTIADEIVKALKRKQGAA